MCKNNTYVLEEHVKVIEEFTKKNKIAISFREAGAHTLKRLEKGCCCKGHDVLEKSIKEKSLEDAILPKDCDINAINKINGLIGHWLKTEKGTILEGVYLSEHGVNNKGTLGFTPEFCTYKGGKNNEVQAYPNIIKITPDLCNALAFDNKKNVNGCFLTGDYDIHDIIDCSIPFHYTIFEQTAETKILCELNKLLRAAGNGNLNDEKNFIRHGAQVNYPAHMLNDEPLQKLAYAVIVADPNLLAFSDGDYKNIKNVDDLRAWYTKNHAKMKITFDSTACSRELLSLALRNMTVYDTIRIGASILKELCVAFEIKDIDEIKTKKLTKGLEDGYVILFNNIKSELSTISKKNLTCADVLSDENLLNKFGQYTATENAYEIGTPARVIYELSQKVIDQYLNDPVEKNSKSLFVSRLMNLLARK